MTSLLKKATPADYERVVSFLIEAKLNPINVENCIQNFLLLIDEKDEIKATIGLDVEQSKGLIRSLAILPSVTQKELIYLIEHCLLFSVELQIEEIYLLAKRSTNPQLFYFFQFEEGEVEKEIQTLLNRNGYEWGENIQLFRKKVNNGYKLSTF